MQGVKCELYKDNFQNFKRYGIPKAQLVIADKPFTMQEANIIPLKAHKIVKIPYCSVCGNHGDDEYDKTPYCPICGAKMDGGKDNEKDTNLICKKI